MSYDGNREDGDVDNQPQDGQAIEFAVVDKEFNNGKKSKGNDNGSNSMHKNQEHLPLISFAVDVDNHDGSSDHDHDDNDNDNDSLIHHHHRPTKVVAQITKASRQKASEALIDRAIFVPSPNSFQEHKHFAKLSFRIGLGFLFGTVPQMMSAAMIHFIAETTADSTKILAGYALGRSFSNLAAMSVAWGFTSALLTLIPQAIGCQRHSIAERNYLLRLYVQRALVITFVVCTLASIPQVFAGAILVAAGQRAELQPIIDSYCRIVIPYTYLLSVYTICQRLAQCLGLNTGILVANFVPFLLAMPINYALIFGADLGWMGAALSLDFFMLITTALSLALLYYRGYAFVVLEPLPLRAVLCERRGVLEYLKLAVPGMVQGSLLWWMSELLMIFSGYVSAQPMVAITTVLVVQQLYFLPYFFVMGATNALNIRLGQYIGYGSVAHAVRVLRVAFTQLVPVLALWAIVFALFYAQLGSLWTDNPAVIALLGQVVYLLCVFTVVVGCYTAFGAVFLAMGYQRFIGLSTLLCVFGIGISLQLVAFFGFDVATDLVAGETSILLCNIIGYVLAGVVMLYIFRYRVSFKQAIADSRNRIDVHDQSFMRINMKNDKNGNGPHRTKYTHNYGSMSMSLSDSHHASVQQSSTSESL